MARSWRHRHGHDTGGGDQRDEGVDFRPHDLSGLFAAPRWLNDLGGSAWLAVGLTLFLVAMVWLLSLTQTIVMPLLTAAVIATVASPVVRFLEGHRVPRGLGSALLFLGLLAVALAMVLVVVGAVTSEASDLKGFISSAKDTLTHWAQDLGISKSGAEHAKQDASSAVNQAVPALLHGVGTGLKHLSSLVVFVAFTSLSLFFLLKDGPQIRGWAEKHMRVPPEVAHGITQRVIQSLRGYFFGVTIVAVFNAVVVVTGALILGVPRAGTIAVVTFLGAYIPYLGAWSAGAFSVLVALGGAGTDAAAGMIVVQLLANSVLQQLVQPIAYGAALGIHPLAVLFVTIAGGSLFGAVGLVLAAPLTAAATRIAGDLAKSREADEEAVAGEGMPEARPVPG